MSRVLHGGRRPFSRALREEKLRNQLSSFDRLSLQDLVRRIEHTGLHVGTHALHLRHYAGTHQAIAANRAASTPGSTARRAARRSPTSATVASIPTRPKRRATSGSLIWNRWRPSNACIHGAILDGQRTNVATRTNARTLSGCWAASRIPSGPENDSATTANGPAGMGSSARSWS